VRVIAVVSFLALGLAACGAGATDPSPGDTVAAPGARPAAADPCAPLARAADATTAVASTAAGRDAALAEAVDDLESALDSLRPADVPASEQPRFRAMLGHYRTMVRAARALRAAQDESVLAAVGAMIVAGQRGSRLARQIGLPRCALFQTAPRPPRDPESPTEAAHALVPAGVRSLRLPVGSGCDQTSCLLPYAYRGAPLAARIRRAQAALRSERWRGIETGSTRTGAWVRAGRGDLKAVVDLVREPGAAPYCRSGKPFPGCVDSVWVYHVEPLTIAGLSEPG
jgi:hypothetical protein